MNYQYNTPQFGNGAYQLGNNFGFSGGINGMQGQGGGQWMANAPGIGTGQQGGFFDGMSGMDIGRMGIGALQTGFNIWQGIGANRLARDQFRLTRDVTNTNLNNSIQSYNTALEDRSRSRAAQEGRSQESAQEYIDRNRLTRG